MRTSAMTTAAPAPVAGPVVGPAVGRAGGPLVALAPALHADLAGLASHLPGARLTELTGAQSDSGAERVVVAVVSSAAELRHWIGKGVAVIAVSSDMDERVALLDAGAVTAAERCGSSELAARVAAVLRRLPAGSGSTTHRPAA